MKKNDFGFITAVVTASMMMFVTSPMQIHAAETENEEKHETESVVKVTAKKRKTERTAQVTVTAFVPEKEKKVSSIFTVKLPADAQNETAGSYRISNKRTSMQKEGNRTVYECSLIKAAHKAEPENRYIRFLKEAGAELAGKIC